MSKFGFVLIFAIAVTTVFAVAAAINDSEYLFALYAGIMLVFLDCIWRR